MKNLRHLLRRVTPSPSPRGLDGRSRSRKSDRVGRPRAGKRRLLSEALESRQLLAGDVPGAVAAEADTASSEIALAHNYWNRFDVNNDKAITALDALTVINHINRSSLDGEMIASRTQFEAFVDVNGDHQATALDALQVVNALNAGEGEDMDDLVEVFLTARDIETDALISNTQGVTEVGPSTNNDVVVEYNVDVGDTFKLEIAVQDLRGFFATGVFQVVNDIFVDQKGVIEPALGEFQQNIYDSSLFSPAQLNDLVANNGMLELAFDDGSGSTQVAFSDLTDAGGFAQWEPIIAQAVADLSPIDAVTDASDVDVTISSNLGSGGPSGGGSVTFEVFFDADKLINLDFPQITSTVLVGGVDQNIPVTEQSFDVLNNDGSFNSATLVRNFDLISRNAGNRQIYGINRAFGSFDETLPGQDVFDSVGALGPTDNMINTFNALGLTFNPNVAYDALAIPVRAVAPATGVDVTLGPATDGEDGVLLYGTLQGDEEVPEDMLAFDETSRLVLNITQPPAPITAVDSPLAVVEDDADGESIDLSTLVTATTTTEPITYAVTSGPTNGSVTLNGSVLTYTPDADYFGPDTITFSATNATDGTATADINVTISAVNDPPVAVADAATTDEDVAVAIDVLDNDNPGPLEMDALTITNPGTPANGVAVVNNGEIVYTPSAGFFGQDNFTYTISDGNLTASATVTVTVNEVATGVQIADQNLGAILDEDDSATTIFADLNTLVTILSGDAPTFSVVSAVGGTAQVVNDSEVQFTPAADFFGPASVTVQATNSDGSDTAVLSFTVNPVNDDPVAPDLSRTMQEDTVLDIDVVAAATDIDSTTLTPSIVTGPINGTAVIAGDQIRYTPNADFFGTDTIVYSIDDGDGGSDQGTITVTVENVFEDPVAADVTRNLTEDDSPIMVDLAALVTVEQGDAFEITVAPGQASFGTYSLAGGTLTYDPADDAFGMDTITYRATSTVTGAADEGTITIDIAAVNDDPVAPDLNRTMLEDTTLDIDVVAASSDVDSTTLTPSIETGPSNGSASIVNGQIRYVPNVDFNGNDSIVYQIDDGDGGSDTGTIDIIVTDTVNVPVADDGTLNATEDAGAVTLDLSTLVTLEAGDSATFTLVGAPSNGSASIVNGILSYTPAADYFGADSVTYQATNVAGSDTGVISITVDPVNDEPVAQDDTAMTVKDRAVTIGVLANDSLGPANEGDTAQLSIDSGPANGQVSITGDNQIVYTPDAGFTGTDSFTYQLSDGTDSDTATVNVTVNDFAFSTISGRVFVDGIDNIQQVIESEGQIAPNRDGEYNPGERVLGGVSVRLQSPAAQNVTGQDIDLVVMSGLDGVFEFEDVPPGEYTVEYQLPNNAIAPGEASDGVVPVSIDEDPLAAGDYSANFVLWSMGDLSTLDSSVISSNNASGSVTTVVAGAGGVIYLDASGNQIMFQAGPGFDGVEYAALSVNQARDAALLTVVRNGQVETAVVDSEHLMFGGSGLSVRLFGGVDDFDFLSQIDPSIASDFPTYQDAVDQILSELS